MSRQKGVTLIEIIVAMSIVAILAAIAYPSYTSYVMRSKRVIAEGDLYAFRNAMQRFFAENYTYTGTVGTGGVPVATFFPSQSPIDGGVAAYNLTATVPAAGNSFTLQATPIGSQAGDRCGNLTLTSTNVRGVSKGIVADCWK